jgi:hypothetical protein
VVLIVSGWSALALYQWSYLTLWAAAVPMLVDARLKRRALDSDGYASPGPARSSQGPSDPETLAILSPMTAVDPAHQARARDDAPGTVVISTGSGPT